MTADWKSISAAMAKQSPIFIAGIPRSGSSVLRFTLARLPPFRGKQPKAAETFAFVRPELVRQILERKGRRLLRYYFGDRAEAEAMLAASAAVAGPGVAGRFALRALTSMRDSDGARQLRWKAANRHHLFRVYFHFAMRARGVERLLEKTPPHVHYVPEIQATFPRARFLFCLRHPVETYASYRKRLVADAAAGRRDRGLEWLRASVGKFSGDFAKVVRDTNAALRDDPRCGTIVDYAELTQQPRATFERVCTVIDTPFDPRILEAEVAELRAADGTPLPEGAVLANRSDWKKYVSVEEAREIESRLAEEMSGLGYRSVL